MDTEEDHEQEDRVSALEKQIETLREEFNSQRAKLKDLYISKESKKPATKALSTNNFTFR